MANSAHPCAGEGGRRIRELTSVVQKRWKFEDGQVELFAEKVMDRGLCAVAQAESLRYKLLGGLAVRRCVTPRAARIALQTDAAAGAPLHGVEQSSHVTVWAAAPYCVQHRLHARQDS